MSLVIDCQSIPPIFSINFLLDEIKHPQFLEHRQDSELGYRYQYEFRVNADTNDPHCIAELKDQVEPILSIINHQSEQIMLQICHNVFQLNMQIGKQIYPENLLWKTEAQPACLDIAYALALFDENHCIPFGDFLLGTDLQDLQIACINSLIEKHGINKGTLYLLGSIALHDKGCQNLLKLLEGKHADAIRKQETVLKQRLTQLNEILRGKYDVNLATLFAALNS